MKEPVRAWVLSPTWPGSPFSEARCLFSTDDPKAMREWVAKVWPKGLPRGAIIGRLTREQYARKWHQCRQ